MPGSILPDIYFTCRDAQHKIYPVSLRPSLHLSGSVAQSSPCEGQPASTGSGAAVRPERSELKGGLPGA